MTGDSGTQRVLQLGPRFIRNATAIVLLILCGFLLVFFLAYVPAERHQVMAEWHARLSSIADDRQAAIEEWVHQRLSDASVVATYPSVIHLASGSAGPPFPFPVEAGATAHLAEIFGIVARAHEYQGVYLVDTAGRLLAASPGHHPLEEACVEVARRTIETGKSSIDFHAHAQSAPVVSAVAPVRAGGPSGHDRIVGVIILSSDPERWLYPLLRREPVPTDSAESFLVRALASDAQFLSPLRHRDDPPMTYSRALDTPGFTARAALAGIRGVGDYVDYRGVPIFAATTTINETPWALVSKVDRAEALAPFAAESRLTAIAGAAFLLAVAASGLSLWRMRRAQYDAALANARARFAVLLDHANDAVLFVAPDGRIQEANRRAETMYGYPRNDLIGKSVLTDLRPPEVQAEAPTVLATALATGEARFETLHRHADGTSFPVEVNSQRVAVEGFDGIVSIIRDIRERRAAEERIATLNRMLRTLSDVNELIIRERDRGALLRKACEVLVERGSFVMAWIGFADADSLRVVPATSAGRVDGYLDAIEIRCDDSALGQGPTGRAIREARTVVASDWGSTDAMAPWSEEARSREYRSSAATPLTLGGRAVGALSVYAEAADAFSPEVVALVEELGQDLSFALESLARDDALAHSEARYRELVEHTATCVAIYEAVNGGNDFVFVAFNSAAEQAEATPRETVLGRRVTDVFPGIVEFGLLDVFRRVYRSGEPENHPITFYVDEHHSGWRENYVYKLASGEVVAIYENVTERKQAELALRESEAHLRALFAAMQDVILVIDRDGRYLSVAPTGTNLLVGPLDELIGKTQHEVLPKEMADWGLSCIRRALEESVTVEVDYSLDLAGEQVWFEGTVSPLADDRVLWVARDVTPRRQTEQRIRDLAERLDLAARAADLGVWDWDIENNVLVWDDRMYDLYGVSKQDFSGAYEAWLAGVHPDDRDAAQATTQAALRGERDYDTEFRVVWPDGTIRYIKAFGLIVRDGDGRPLRMTGINYDVTERVEAEEDLRTSRAEYRELVENLNDVIYRVTTDGTIVYLSPTIERVLGYKPEELVGTDFADRILPGDAEAIKGAFVDALGGTQYPSEYRFLHEDGSVRWVRTSSRLWQVKGAAAGLQGVLTDITERHEAERTAQEKAAEAERYFTLSVDLLCIADVDGHFVRLNPEWERALGYPLEQLQGVRFLDLVHPDDLEATIGALATLSAQQPVLSFTNRYRASDGTYRWIEWRSFPSGKLIYAAARDITESQEAARKLAEQLDELRRWQTATLGREGRILELKREVNEALARTGQPPRYETTAAGGSAHDARSGPRSPVSRTPESGGGPEEA